MICHLHFEPNDYFDPDQEARLPELVNAFLNYLVGKLAEVTVETSSWVDIDSEILRLYRRQQP